MDKFKFENFQKLVQRKKRKKKEKGTYWIIIYHNRSYRHRSMIEYYIVTNDIIITNVVRYYASNRIYATAVRFQIDIFVFYLNLLLFTLKMRLTCYIYVLSFFFTFSKSEKYYIILMLKSFFICISSQMKANKNRFVYSLMIELS